MSCWSVCSVNVFRRATAPSSLQLLLTMKCLHSNGLRAPEFRTCGVSQYRTDYITREEPQLSFVLPKQLDQAVTGLHRRESAQNTNESRSRRSQFLKALSTQSVDGPKQLIPDDIFFQLHRSTKEPRVTRQHIRMTDKLWLH